MEFHAERPKFELIAPSTVAVGETFTVKLRVRKEPVKAPWQSRSAGRTYLNSPFNLSPRGTHWLNNTDWEWTGAVKLDPQPTLDGPAEVSFGSPLPPGQPRTPLGPFRFAQPGIHWLTGIDADSGEAFTSNPIEVLPEPPAARLYWGDLHAHTFYSDAIRSPEEMYQFARNEAGLDVFCLADHSETLSDSQWREMVAISNDFNDPGRFATLVAFEWTKHNPGHRNVYYRGDDGPLLRCTDPRYDTLDKLYAACDPTEAILVPHHSANVVMGVTWEAGHSPELERLVEICSVWGSSEIPEEAGNRYPIRTSQGEQAGRHVRDALAMGYRFGFIGSGDIHDGRPGEDLHCLQETTGYGNLHPQGYAALWLPKLERREVWQALRDRRCYATTSARIILHVTVADGELRVLAAANGPVRQLLAVADGVERELPLTNADPRSAVASVPLAELGGSGSYLYVRVETEKGEFAWSSPSYDWPS